jgi:guanine nucleotide-binding protein subunit alpha
MGWIPKFILIYSTGAGESGKSTLVKQMKIIHSDGFTRDELRSFRPTVMDNLLSSMKYVLGGMGLLRINLQNAKNKVGALQSRFYIFMIIMSYEANPPIIP